jgi:hypothetical protein
MQKILITAALIGSSIWGVMGLADAQIAGSTTIGVSATEANQVAMGWSVKKSILGKTVFNDAGEKIGRVQDLIVAPDRSVSYLIIGAGGFIGIGTHDVAIPVSQVHDRNGRLEMAGATREVVKAMPPFVYATDASRRDQYLDRAEVDLVRARARVAELQVSSSQASGAARVAFDRQVAVLQRDEKAAEDRIAEMKRAGASRWRQFERDVDAAIARLRKSIDMAVG